MKHLLGLPVAAVLALGTMSMAQAQDLVFELFNDSSVDLMEFYTSPANVNDWEEDVLGNEYLPSGYAIDVLIADGRSDCVYDIRGVFDDGDVVEDFGVDLCDLEAYTFYDIAQTEDLVFELFNDTSVDLMEFYTSPANVNEWEEDVLGSEYLPSGYAVDVVIADGRSDCVYDIRGVFYDGDEVEDFEVDLCDLEAYTFYEE